MSLGLITSSYYCSRRKIWWTINPIKVDGERKKRAYGEICRRNLPRKRHNTKTKKNYTQSINVYVTHIWTSIGLNHRLVMKSKKKIFGLSFLCMQIFHSFFFIKELIKFGILYVRWNQSKHCQNSKAPKQIPVI